MIHNQENIRWLDTLIASGIFFLRKHLGTEADGLWRDFELPGISVGSTEWVSAFIAAQIGSIPEGRELASDVIRTITAKSRPTGGWGYREDVPEDCDSTAWVLLAAIDADVSLPSSLVKRSLQFILEHQQSAGGFVTFGSAAKKLIETPDRSGWFEPEVSVTSAAVLAIISAKFALDEPVRRACIYISQHMCGGLWKSYWWRGFAYATYHALLALSRVEDRFNEEQLATTGQTILQMQGSGGGWSNEQESPENGFSTSFALRTVLLTNKTLNNFDLIIQSLQFLASLQMDDGSFLPSTEMLAPGGIENSNLILNDKGLVTTACVVRAFHEVRTRFNVLS